MGSATHWQNVDEVSADDSDYNEHGAPTVATDLYALDDFTQSGTINTVKPMWRMSQIGGGSGGPDDIVWRESATTGSTEWVALGNAFETMEVFWTSPPESGGSWDGTKLDGLELGASHNGTHGRNTAVSWLAAMVDYDNLTTEVTLTSFTATGGEGEVVVDWETGSELNNLGFHLYRAESEAGPYARITAAAIPGLGSSPVGAKYSYRDTGLTNGVTYYYELEDIETTGETELHGPVSATPQVGASSSSPVDESSPTSTSLITYGDPSANSLRVLQRGRRHVVLELETTGFYAEPQEDGTVRITIPDFAELAEAGSPSMPVKRTWVEALAGRKVELVSVTARDVEAFTSLRPSEAEMPEVVARRDGTVRAARRRARVRALSRGEELYPSEAARLVSVGFQGEVKKALVELAPLRWDGATGQLVLAQRLVVRLSFRGRERDERSTDGVRGRRYRRGRSHEERAVVARLATTERGLYALRYEDVFGPGRGEAVAFHLEPDPNRFKRGSMLYFVSEGASANPYGNEAVYELEVGRRGAVASARHPERGRKPSGTRERGGYRSRVLDGDARPIRRALSAFTGVRRREARRCLGRIGGGGSYRAGHRSPRARPDRKVSAVAERSSAHRHWERPIPSGNEWELPRAQRGSRTSAEGARGVSEQPKQLEEPAKPCGISTHWPSSFPRSGGALAGAEAEPGSHGEVGSHRRGVLGVRLRGVGARVPS